MPLLERVPNHVKELIPYPPGKPIDEVEREYGISGSVKLASNECPLGPSPLAVKAVETNLSSLNFYPDGSGHYLKRKLAKRFGLEPSNLILGNGSNEVIELIARAFMEKGDEAVMGDPAFIVYRLITLAVGGVPRPVPLKDFVHDLDAMAGAITPKTKVVYVANPNNPTGTVASSSEMTCFFDAIPEDVLIVWDEAYHEYADGLDGYEGAATWLKKKSNLIILRTFSKAYGLAGLRVGYGMASKEVIDLLDRVRQPFNLNSLALAGAEAALDDAAHIEKGRQVNSDGMAFLTDELDKMGLNTVKSFANFILFDAGRDGDTLYEELLKKGVIVRPMTGYGLKNFLRVTVGLPDENKRFIETLKSTLKVTANN